MTSHTASSGADAPAVTATVASLPAFGSSRAPSTRRTRVAPARRATRTRAAVLADDADPTTITASTAAATSRSAPWRFDVA